MNPVEMLLVSGHSNPAIETELNFHPESSIIY